MLLTKDQILGADDLTYKEVSVPEWGGTVRLRSMTGADRDEYEQIIIANRKASKSDNIANLRALLLSYCIVDDKGNRLLSKDDVDALGKKSIKALQRLFNVAVNLNALSADDVEELAGN